MCKPKYQDALDLLKARGEELTTPNMCVHCGQARVVVGLLSRAAVVEVLRTPGLDHRRELARLPVSRAHLRALFARDIGTPIPTYARRRRRLDTLAALGSNATVAAHATGFADLAHFSRTCLLADDATQLEVVGRDRREARLVGCTAPIRRAHQLLFSGSS